jgi:lipooligosaccharide transport system permease protein
MVRALRIVQRNSMVYRRTWHGSLFLSFLQPALFLMAMGVGLGRLIDRAGGALPGGVPYLVFLAPGLLAATCMQTASFESSFAISGKMTWRRNYEAMFATPVRVIDIVLGELAWMGLRMLTVATAFTAVLAGFGAARSPLVVAAIPAAALTGLAFSAPIMAYAAHLESGGNFNAVFRFVITPLFLFSGVFFPVTRLPGPLQTAALFTPLFHGVELTRGLALGTLTWPAAAVHVGYLVALCTAGVRAAVWTFSRKLRA